MPELDTIRGIAILGVVLYHAFYWGRDLSVFPVWQRRFLLSMSPGQFGVNLFFVLSGFLITGILIDSKKRPDYYSRFYFRRILRILPAYYFTILLLILLGVTSRGFLLMSLAYCANLCGLFGIALSYPVLWSLAVEEHFYLVWPAVVKRFTEQKLIYVVSAIVIFSPVSRYLYHMHAAHTGTNTTSYYYTWNNADGLALGALVALLLRRPDWKRQQLRNLCIAFLVLVVLIVTIGYPESVTRRTPLGDALQFASCNLASAGLLGIFLLVGSSSWKSVVTPTPLIFLGKISYGLYLYHVLFFRWVVPRIHFETWMHLSQWEGMWLRAFVAGGMAVVFSYLSRQYLEEPFLRLKDMLPRLVSQVQLPVAEAKPIAPDRVSDQTGSRPEGL